METIYRKEKVKMFLMDYYVGFNTWIKILRVIGGPFLILIGYDLFRKGTDKFSVAYSGFCLLYGAYLLLKPYLWVLLRAGHFKSEPVEIDIVEDGMVLKDEKNESKLSFDTFKTIRHKKGFLLFVTLKSQRLRIPERFFDPGDIALLRKNCRYS
jgi:hypothetical protein